MRVAHQRSDHPGYSCERAPWALVTGVGPLETVGSMVDVRTLNVKATVERRRP